jgi:hypothetical protein
MNVSGVIDQNIYVPIDRPSFLGLLVQLLLARGNIQLHHMCSQRAQFLDGSSFSCRSDDSIAVGEKMLGHLEAETGGGSGDEPDLGGGGGARGGDNGGRHGTKRKDDDQMS